MIEAQRWGTAAPRRTLLRIGTAGHLAILAWSLAMVMLVPAPRIQWAAALCVGVALLVYPLSLQRLLRPRWLLLLALLALPPILLLGEVDATVLGFGVRMEGLRAGVQIAARFVVVMVAVDGFTSAVDIAAIAGLLERFGLQGLGFCMGVALNLLPALQQSALHAWHSLWMRGGLRRQWGRAMRLLVVTVVSNALRRAEEIALAAEARAFSPDCARPMPIQVGRLDWLATALAAVALVGFCFLR
jgi:energy-coupling factor transporter transmembrane protein EcfT